MSDTVLENPYLDLKKLSEYSCLSQNTLRDHIKHGGLPAYKVGGKILVKKSEFDDWVEDQRLEVEDLDSIAEEAIESLQRQDSIH